MAIKFSEGTITSVNNFNTKYGVNFNLDEYVSKASKTSPNEALKAMFANMYKKVLHSNLGKEEADKRSAEMFYDFNKNVISSLKVEFNTENKNLYPHKNAGMSKLERYHLMESVWNDIPKNDTDLVADKYKNGEIRIRDMVAYATEKEDYSKLDRITMTIMASYAEALKNVNASRSFFWKVFHPIRNNAEKRDAKLIQSIVTEKNGEYAYKSAVQRASEGLLNFSDIKMVTTHNTLGVYKVEEYNPNTEEDLLEALDPVLDREKIAQLRGDDDKDVNYQDYFKNTKESISIDDLKEVPYANDASDKKFEELVHVHNAPSLNK